MAFDLRQSCKKCGKQIDISDMRTSADGGYVCRSCYESKDGGLRPLSEDNSPNLGTTENFFEQKEYVCEHCEFQFKRNSDFNVKKCPFCGKDGGVHQVVEDPADKLLDEE